MPAKGKTITEDDDGEEQLVAVEVDEKGKPIVAEDDEEQEPEPKPKPDPDDDEPGEDDDEGDDPTEDKRLADHEEDDEHAHSNAEKRKARRQRAKLAREALDAEVAALRAFKAQAEQRFANIEGHVVNTDITQLDAKIGEHAHNVRQAEQIIAKAVSEGNGDDVAAAMRIRDAAMLEHQRLTGVKQQIEQAKTNQPDQTVMAERQQAATYAKQWAAANPWYQPDGSDNDSLVTRAIDNQIAQEGYRPGTRAYWQELTRRVADALGTQEEDEVEADTGKKEANGRRKSPPVGTSREQGRPRTPGKNEFYVSPERKAAMIEAGVWDDPALRQKYLKSYQAYDRDAAR